MFALMLEYEGIIEDIGHMMIQSGGITKSAICQNPQKSNLIQKFKFPVCFCLLLGLAISLKLRGAISLMCTDFQSNKKNVPWVIFISAAHLWIHLVFQRGLNYCFYIDILITSLQKKKTTDHWVHWVDLMPGLSILCNPKKQTGGI